MVWGLWGTIGNCWSRAFKIWLSHTWTNFFTQCHTLFTCFSHSFISTPTLYQAIFHKGASTLTSPISRTFSISLLPKAYRVNKQDFLSTSGPCHSYVQQRNRTGGWTDVWCPHNTKIGSKMETMQETVSDVSDVIHCMKKLPTLHILDDACHFTR